MQLPVRYADIWIEYKYDWICNWKSVNNMKTILSVLFVLAGAYAFTGDRTKTGDKDVLIKQKVLFELLQHPYQPGVSIYKPDYLNIVQSFDFERSWELFNNVDAVKQFYYYYQKGLMPYNELFSIYNENYRRQAIALFHVFYYAKGTLCSLFQFALLIRTIEWFFTWNSSKRWEWLRSISSGIFESKASVRIEKLR